MIISLIVMFVISITLVGFSLYYGISPMPSSRKAKRALFSLIPPYLEGTVYELGSGWGTLAFPLAKTFPSSLVRAFEISPIPWLVTKIVKIFFNFPNLILRRRDFFKIKLHDARLVVCYLYPGAMERLKEKFQQELQPGTLIVTNTFAIPGWIPEKVIEIENFYRSKIYLYVFKQ